MEEKKKARGRGRIIERLKERARERVEGENEKDVENVSEMSEVDKEGGDNRVRGEVGEISGIRRGCGRADLRERVLLMGGKMKSKKECVKGPGLTSLMGKSVEEGSNIESMNKKLEEMDLDKKEKYGVVQRKQCEKLGKYGTKIPIETNFVKLRTDPSKKVFEYEVTFSPSVDYVNYRYRILYENFPDKKDVLCYDGASKLFTPEKITADVKKFNSKLPNDGSNVTMSIKFKHEAVAEQCASLYNTLFNNISRVLRYTRFGKKYFDHGGASQIPHHKLEIWPGYVSSVNNFDGGIQLHFEVNHRVLRTETALDVISYIVKVDPKNVKSRTEKELLGQSVLTRYNNSFYRIDDIEWSKSPTSTFELRGGEQISFLQYYKKQYNLDIKDLKQPLLLSRVKSVKGKKDAVVCLVPEICHMTGLTDKMKSDVRVMKDIARFTRVTPLQRSYAFKQFLGNIAGSDEARKILEKWGLSLEPEPLQTEGRNLGGECILFGNRKAISSVSGDWCGALRDLSVFTSVDILSWILFYPEVASSVAANFVTSLKRMGPGLGIRIESPKKVVMKDDRIDTYATNLLRNIDDNTQIVVCLCSTSRDDRYRAIKKICCLEKPVPSQVICTNTLAREDRSMSVVLNIALQMNHKLGGAGWALQIPFKNTMICGMDSYHEQLEVSGSVGGFVASTDSNYTRWYSRVHFQGPKEELNTGIRESFSSSLEYYHEVNGVYPARIIVYRDGLGDGELQACLRIEIPQFLQVMKEKKMYTKFSFVIVQKRISTKFYELRGSTLENVAPGGIVDHTITKENFYDFYLVSQMVRCGTVNPTRYVVIYDDSKLEPDHVQRLTYKFCHLYYNYAGTIRTPAPCQYAHKLCYLVGQYVKNMPNKTLENKLYYL